MGGDDGLVGLMGLVGDREPTGDSPIGDMGARGGGAGVIAGIKGVDRSTVRSGLLLLLVVLDVVPFVASSSLSDNSRSTAKSADSLLAACLSR